MSATDRDMAERIRRECPAGDPEAAHSLADGILLELLLALGYNETVEAWQAVDKWYA